MVVNPEKKERRRGCDAGYHVDCVTPLPCASCGPSFAAPPAPVESESADARTARVEARREKLLATATAERDCVDK